MVDSILNSTKKLLGVPVEDEAFDADILVHINGTMSTLHQLGVGPTDQLLIVDKDTEWVSLTNNPVIQGMSKQFVYLNVRLLFDPPGTSYLLESFTRSLSELTWRLEVEANPYTPTPEEDEEEA